MYSPLEIEEKQEDTSEKIDQEDDQDDDDEKEGEKGTYSFRAVPKLNLFSLFFILAMMTSSILSLIPSMVLLYSLLKLTGRWYFGGIVIVPQFLEKIHVWLLIRRVKVHHNESFLHRSFSIPVFGIRASNPFALTNTRVYRCCNWKMAIFIVELTIMLLLSVLYLRIIPWLCKDIVISFFIGIDGTFSVDWDHIEDEFETIYHTSLLTGSFYVFSLVFGVLALIFVQDRVEDSTTPGRMMHASPIATRNIDVNQRSCLRATTLFRIFRSVNIALLLTMTVLLGICLNSAFVYLFTNRIPKNNNIGEHCDPLDTTECMLPFPSSFFTIKDETSETGFRVNIDLDAMTTLYRGPKVKHPIQLHTYDGFITSGPILFYLEGVKEGKGLGYNGTSRLIPPNEMELSVTSQSMTLLLDVTDGVLLPHFAEIDSLDKNLPVIIVQPAWPLKHNRRYAVALVDAIGADGEKLESSPYLNILLDETSTLMEKEKERGTYFRTTVLPSLYNAASWLNEDSKIQMLFDFHTMSAESQLGPTRKAIENSLNIVRRESWENKVRVVKVDINDKCLETNQDIDRLLHLEVDLPTFMKGDTRTARLDHDALLQGSSGMTSPVKVVVLVPCKVAAGIVPLRAVMQFGHGFLYSRQEILDLNTAHRIANDNGYLIFASNWRGMSYLDIPIVFKAFVSQPDLMMSIRDNIIQGYANRAALQEFASVGLVELSGQGINMKPPPDGQLRKIFYGISQGGILGSAFSALLAPYNLLDGSIIVSAGTPFSLLMSRSTIFPAYNTLLRLGLHNARHVRIFISIMQMLYDSIEVGGVLTSDTERVPTLLQQGFGDATVTNIASNYMLRAYDTSTFSSNPIHPYGIHIEKNESVAYSTDILYKEEFQNLPSINSGTTKNKVHICARKDGTLLNQMIEFCNTGTFLNVCEQDPNKCIRGVASC